jgi:uncharacterized protein
VAVVFPIASALDWRCALGSPETCLAIGQAELRRGRAPRALRLFRWSCDRGLAQSCTEAGLVLLDSKKRREEEAGVALLERACGMGDGDGCRALAGDRADQARDPAAGLPLLEKAARAYEVACAAGSSRACRPVGMMMLTSKPRPGLEAEAVTHLRRGRTLGDAISCMAGARTYRKGTNGVAVDLTVAAGMHRRACEIDHVGADCCAAGTLLAHATPGPSGESASRELFARACDGGEVHGCIAAWRTVGDGVVPAALVAAADGFARACGPTYPPNWCDSPCPGTPALVREVAKIEALCNADERRACYVLGLMDVHGIGTNGDPNPGTTRLRAVCDAGLGMACAELGRLSLREWGTQSAVRALALFRRGCRLGSASACRSVERYGRP